MLLADVNVLVYAFKRGTPRHDEYRAWLTGVLDAPEPLALSPLVLSGVIRVVTDPRVFDPPSTVDEAVAYVQALRAHQGSVEVAPGARHWDLFMGLVTESKARGNLAADAFHAALAIEHGCEWVTTDRDYARFGGLRWRHPLV